MTKDCIFCAYFERNDKNIFKLDGINNFTFFWDEMPVTAGHLLVIPNRHIRYFTDLTDAERDELLKAVARAYKVLAAQDFQKLYEGFLGYLIHKKSREYCTIALETAKKFQRKPDAYNHGLNDGAAAGQTVPHFHYHIIPRWEGDVVDPKGGIRHIFPGMGNYHKGVQK